MAIDPKRLQEFQDLLAGHFERRAEAIGLWGVGRDEHATTFWAGAAMALHLIGGHEDLAEAIAKHGVLEIAIRGGIDLSHGLTKASYTRIYAPWDRRD